MDRERWTRIEALYAAALAVEPARRADFLKENCGGDESLRGEVESLVLHGEGAGRFLEPAAKGKTLEVGQSVSHYEIQKKLGEGGMGAVYLAYDRQLRRPVALKVLPPESTADPEQRRRLLREARAASGLNHPNIVAIHEVGSDNGVDFIAMEFVEGRTLSDVIPTKGLPVAKALEYGVQIASGLARAHAAGVIHRDLKPQNVMVTADGLVKLLDFGLARRLKTERDAETTVSVEGEVSGTPAYMSPEQAEGKPLDARSDIFSFGVVLYEMLAGQRAFGRDSTAAVLAAVLREEPSPLPEMIPHDLRQILARCLRKDPARRFQHVDDVKVELDEMKGEVQSGKPPLASAIGPVHKRAGKPLWIAVAAALLLLAAAAVYLYFGRGRTIDSLAVLPMVNADASTEYLSDGITENLINNLSQLPKLRVMSRSSVLRYKGRATDPQVAGRELNVQAVLVSWLIQRGENLSISTELVDARDNTHLWGGQYNRKLADIQTVQEDIGREISDKLRLKLTGGERKSLARRQTQDTEAYQDYLKGRYYWNKRTAAGLTTAIEHFNSAIAKDPTFALAHVGLADCYAALSLFAVVAPRESVPKARAAALKALEFDDTLGEAHAALARVKAWYDLDWAGAERDFNRAIELNPRHATARLFYARYLATMARMDESLAEIKRAQALDPLSLPINAEFGIILVWSRRLDQAVDQLRQTVSMDPSFGLAHFYLGRAYEAKRMYPEAIAEFRTGLGFVQADALMMSGLGHAYALSGNRTEARTMLDDLLARSKRSYFSPSLIATLYISLGDKDRAFQWLGEAVEGKDQFFVIAPKTAFIYDALRSDPRFRNLLRRLNLAP